MEQKIYSCVLRFKGDMLHSIPKEEITKHELQLLAFIHGTPAIAELRYLRTGRVIDTFLTTARDDGQVVYVESEMDEFKRLARQYDTIVNSGRGRKAVEECFRIRIEDFDSIVAEVDAVDAMEKKAAEAEAKAALQNGGESRTVAMQAALEVSPPTIGSRVFAPPPR